MAPFTAFDDGNAKQNKKKNKMEMDGDGWFYKMETGLRKIPGDAGAKNSHCNNNV